MKNYSISPTDEHAAELLQVDPIGRNNHIKRFLQLLDTIEENCSIALNGEWGSGKSMFVRQVKLLLDYQNPQYEQSDTLKEIIRPVAAQFPECQNQATVYYDAWANDDHDDPVLSLVYATMISGQSEYCPEKKRKLSEILARIANAVTGRPIAEVLKAVKGTDYLEALKQRDDIHALVRAFLDELISEKANRLVIFIDELDRCRPVFAVQLLERIKHYFDDERVTFVFSVNLTQLQHTVKGYYGYAFDATRYLDKFFDLRLMLPEANREQFVRYRFSFTKNTGNIYPDICVYISEKLSFSLRELERYMRLTHIIVHKAVYAGRHSGVLDEKARLFAFAFIVPAAVAISMCDMNAYGDFVSGKNAATLKQVLEGILNDAIGPFLGGTREGRETEEPEQALNKIYELLFSSKGKEELRARGVANIGEMRFTMETRKAVMNALTFLSEWADYKAE